MTSGTASTDAFAIRPLRAADLARACALSAEVGWNQVTADWEWMLAHGRAFGIDAAGEGLIATGLRLPYGRDLAWIAMIIVTERWRRRGLATRLVRHTLEIGDGEGRLVGLDATVDGRKVYQNLGFRDVYRFDRWVGRSDRAASHTDTAGLARLEREDLVAIARTDVAAFGADRAGLLRHLRARRPDLAVVAAGGRNFALARDGRIATHIGPVVAADAGTARRLIAAALGAIDGPVILDVPQRHEELTAWLRDLGLKPRREFMRMLLRRDAPLDRPERIFALAGPELA